MESKVEYLDITDFIKKSKGILTLDVRAPKEFKKGHIPSATSFPLFDDIERAEVGTAYKKQSKEKAIELGLDIVGKKMGDFARTLKTLTQDKKVFVYCWRGGMRSGSLAWLINLLGYEVFVLKGGYKSYRNFVLEGLGKPFTLSMLSGQTGSGKTQILQALQSQGEQVIDLEAIAHHKGSAFGGLGLPAQPSPEQFENNLYEALSVLDTTKNCWIEDESKAIGTCYLPEPFWLQMKQAPLYNITVPLEKRIAHLVDQYGQYSVESLTACVKNLEKRLGTEAAKLAIEKLAENNLRDVAILLLHYYDKAYSFGTTKKVNVLKKNLFFETQSDSEIAKALIHSSKQNIL